ncbi:NADH-ubiquinone oxidoreductase-F iron-sulfur binding region domain-containing protein [Neptuniibacter sp.]|uniref:NADH-ubiquinone oxidoreductase-F iron-sulfur binding region domain-containing protein n=1 Tax=Neptuniibacter sp. TaxID=1962643 RepID=UPI0026374FEB|nr:NADH-ubiquinone oxidoreductase-F iron-sulfur binding region domain-containing protein [Neptuniibacter sp.]MCP4596443.1 NADH-quinone oxidoreductase subunit F [Neptuniibacter sp.]
MKASFPKGRRVNEMRLSEVTKLLGEDANQRDLLIENLHVLQDEYGYLSRDTLAALAEAMRLSQAEVYECATFYAHFQVSDEPDDQHIKYCDGITCQISRQSPLPIGSKTVPCVGACSQAPVTVHDIAPTVNYPDLNEYQAQGGYAVLQSLQNGKIDTAFILSELEKSQLCGMGGAGFPVARKWQFLLASSGERVLVVNADEGEPGTFKDRHCLETNPHQMLEGMLIAAEVIDAKDIYIYLRDEYPHIRSLLLKELENLRQSDLCKGRTLHLRRGAGAYICGEETALLESIEGKRGLPRIKPPYPAQSGLFGRPTLVNNVETLWRVTEILNKGAQNYIDAGCPRFYSVSGRVNKPGVVEAPSGTSVNTLISEYCGGLLTGHSFKAYLPGGASGGILPAGLGDLPLSFGELEQYGCFVGSAAVVVLSDQDNMKAVVQNLMNFFDHESCGQCTPCRVGCEKIAGMFEDEKLDFSLLEELSEVMRSASICGLGQAAPNPLISAMTYFAEDFR